MDVLSVCKISLYSQVLGLFFLVLFVFFTIKESSLPRPQAWKIARAIFLLIGLVGLGIYAGLGIGGMSTVKCISGIEDIILNLF